MMKRILAITPVAAILLCSCTANAAVATPQKTGDAVTVFSGERLAPQLRDVHVSYNLNPSKERYFVHVPENYDGSSPFGLIVYTDPEDRVDDVPDSWSSVLDSRKLLFVAAENAGNGQYISRRLGLAVLGALEMMKRYQIDPHRVYAAGLSGGARVAGLLGFYQSDVFHGTIQNCGADFYKRVPEADASSSLDFDGQPYGVFAATGEEIARAKHVRFVLITGTNDPRHGNILDIYNGGFAREGFRAKLIDVPGMGHTNCDAETLSTALGFIEGSS